MVLFPEVTGLVLVGVLVVSLGLVLVSVAVESETAITEEEFMEGVETTIVLSVRERIRVDSMVDEFAAVETVETTEETKGVGVEETK